MNKHLLTKIALGVLPRFAFIQRLLIFLLLLHNLLKQEQKILIKKFLSNLNKPHALLWGPDNQIWLTERATGRL